RHRRAVRPADDVLRQGGVCGNPGAGRAHRAVVAVRAGPAELLPAAVEDEDRRANLRTAVGGRLPPREGSAAQVSRRNVGWVSAGKTVRLRLIGCPARNPTSGGPRCWVTRGPL